MIDKFKTYMLEEGLSQNTYNSYLKDIELFEKYYKDSYNENLIRLSHADISMYKSYLLNHNISAQTVNRKLYALKMYNKFLVEEKIQNDIVVREKDYIKIQDCLLHEDIPTQEQVNKLKHFASQDKKNAKRDFCFICLLIYGGFRESELIKIKLTDIKLNERFINIIGKGNKFRQVVINDLMYDALRYYIEERESMKIKNPYLFIGQKNKNTVEHLNRNFCNRLLNKYKKLCKILNLHPHLLRAFFCSNALHNAGYTIEQVANQAGHSSLNTTRVYLRTKNEDLLTLSNKL